MTTTDPEPQGVLSAAGATPTKALSEYRRFMRAHQTAQQRVLDDEKWTSQAKRDELSRLHNDALTRRDELRKEHHQQVDGYRAELHKAAFGPRRQADLGAWRDAAMRATGLEDEQRALIALDVARKAGDELWARALGATAVEQGWANVVTRYVDTYPDARQAVEELQALSSPARRIEDDFGFAPPSVPKVPDRGPAELEAERRARGYGPQLSGRALDISRGY